MDKDYRKLFNDRCDAEKYIHNNVVNVYGLITEIIYARLDVLFEEGEFDEYIKKKLGEEI
jgi:hypothetical protein